MKLGELKKVLNELQVSDDREIYFTDCEGRVAYDIDNRFLVDRVKGQTDYCAVLTVHSVGLFMED